MNLSRQIDEVIVLLDFAISPELRRILNARFDGLASRIEGEKILPGKRPDEATWEVIRKAILKRDGHRCALCMAEDRPLQVHHLVAVEQGGETIPNNLLTLCDECHAIIHPWLA